MRTKEELAEIIKSYPVSKINAHVHTHLCDGRPDMTVENIAKRAEIEGFAIYEGVDRTVAENMCTATSNVGYYGYTFCE